MYDDLRIESVVSKVPHITLNNDVAMPQLGYGVWQVPDDEAATAVGNAWKPDTAASTPPRSTATRRHGEGARRLRASRVTSSSSRRSCGTTSRATTRLRAFDTSLGKLGLEYVDLYLIHWPMPAKDTYVDTYRAFEKIYEEGRAKAIGVSNFQPAHLERLLGETSVVPAVNQVELHPQLQQSELRAFHARHNIATEAWSPLGQGKDLLKNTTVTGLAEKYGRTPAQIVLRWHLQLGNVVIPKSVTPSRIKENIDVFGFELDDADMSALAALDSGTRLARTRTP